MASRSGRLRALLRATASIVVASASAGCSQGNDEAPAPTPAFPCEIQATLTTVCQRCHSRPPRNGTPFPLVTYEDTHAPYTHLPSYDKVPTFKVMGDAVALGVMPAPLPGLTFTDEQRSGLLRWVDAGAPAAAPGTRCP